MAKTAPFCPRTASDGRWLGKKRQLSPRTGLGSAPAPGAADDALVVGHGDVTQTMGECRGFARRVHREGAANDSRGGCASQILRRDVPQPGWFFLDKIFRGRKVKSVKRTKRPISPAKSVAADEQFNKPMTLREAKSRKDLCERIQVAEIGEEKIQVICPSSISNQLYDFLKEKHMNPSKPQRYVNAADSDDEIIATGKAKNAKQEISKFITSVSL